MPKIIENLENLLMEEAERQIRKNGYRAVTIRSVAAEAGVGVGTVYNYFPSKDALLASFMLTDWQKCMDRISRSADHADTPEPVIRTMHEQLCRFTQQHEGIICDEGASTSFAGSFRHYHVMLRSQLAQPLRKFCESDFASQFIAEAVLAWTMAGREFDDIYGMIRKLF